MERFVRSDNKVGTGRQVHEVDGRRGAARDDLIIDARREAFRAGEAAPMVSAMNPESEPQPGEQASDFRPTVFKLLCKRLPTFGGL
ncbi:hypothetical protein K7H91_22700 [Martelella mediterranea]|uniref:hypothetical protein n=1 Tax=Martelella mediterranea TaxID=293089 RepID=UPI001E464EE0|nr:hypothetical protein [Martelella mediterranea]MCD1636569.1 hypothetical protein [Martelella mediterranea]